MGAAVTAAPRLSPRGDVTLTFIHCSWDAMCRLCGAVLGQTSPVVSYSHLLLLIPLLLMWGDPELLTPTGSWSAQRPVLPGQCAGPHLQPLGLKSPRIFVLTPQTMFQELCPRCVVSHGSCSHAVLPSTQGSSHVPGHDAPISLWWDSSECFTAAQECWIPSGWLSLSPQPYQ